MEESKCINCDKTVDAGCWFCKECTVIKEKSYKISKEKNENWIEVLKRRDKMLKIYGKKRLT